MIWRLLRAALSTTALVVVAAAATFLYIAWSVNNTGQHDRAQQADAIVILGARVTPEGAAGPDLRVRTLHAVDLYRRGLAPYLICTGGYRGDRLSAAAVACDLAVSMGVPAEQALLADGSTTTQEDAVSAGELMLNRGWSTAILVSHPLHLERARILFGSQQLTVYPSPTNTDLASIPWRERARLT
ncbi:MAG: YdcF family protein, partial [Anaerolineae bacterium]